MIVNKEQDNTIEGEYIRIITIDTIKQIIKFELPNNFYVNSENCKNWVIGWGKQIEYFNAGVENIREIIAIKKNSILLGSIKRGTGFPKKNQKIAFWNTHPSGFINYNKKEIINTNIWPEFSGKSVAFSDIKFDSILNKWVLIANECDTSTIQIYAAISNNLIDWEAANNGKPIFTASDFKGISWAGYDKTGQYPQTPFVSDIIRFNEKWYLFMDGYDSKGKRHIGVAISNQTLINGYKIIKSPVLTCGKKNDWNNDASFYAKVSNYKDGFIMFYDGRNVNGLERVGMAISSDLINWENSTYNPVINQHSGWRSNEWCTEPNYIEIRNDTILVMIAGAKKFNNSRFDYYIKRDRNMGKTGNVDDAQLGLYYTVNNGKDFYPYLNNPIFTNDYSNKYENEHMGGNFSLIKTDSINYIFYQAKTSYNGLKYSIMLRTRKTFCNK